MQFWRNSTSSPLQSYASLLSWFAPPLAAANTNTGNILIEGQTATVLACLTAVRQTCILGGAFGVLGITGTSLVRRCPGLSTADFLQTSQQPSYSKKSLELAHYCRQASPQRTARLG